MLIFGNAYSVPLTQAPVLLKLRSATANGVILQPQGTPMSYRLDGVVEAVCGFGLTEDERIVLHFNHVVVWATGLAVGRVVVQEVK